MGPEAYWLELLRYQGDQGASYRTSLSTVGDTTNLDSIGIIPVFKTYEESPIPLHRGKTTLLIHGRFTDGTAATSVWVVKGFCSTYGNGPTYSSTFTAVAVEPLATTISATSLSIGGKFISAEAVADLFGFTAAKVLYTPVSTGSMDLWVRMV